MKKYLWGLIYGIFLTIFTVYVLLDTFVITRVYTKAENMDNYFHIDETGTKAVSGNENGNGNKITISDSNSYVDNNIAITVTEYRNNNTSVYVADVKLSSPEYLKTAFAQSSYGKNVTQKTSDIAMNNGAILAINGDYYGVQEKGYVLRNGTLYRKTVVNNSEDLVIYKNGSFSIINESEISAEQLLANNAMHILSFGPALVIKGAISVTANEEVGKARAYLISTGRIYAVYGCSYSIQFRRRRFFDYVF